MFEINPCLDHNFIFYIHPMNDYIYCKCDLNSCQKNERQSCGIINKLRCPYSSFSFSQLSIFESALFGQLLCNLLILFVFPS